MLCVELAVQTWKSKTGFYGLLQGPILLLNVCGQGTWCIAGLASQVSLALPVSSGSYLTVDTHKQPEILVWVHVQVPTFLWLAIVGGMYHWLLSHLSVLLHHPVCKVRLKRFKTVGLFCCRCFLYGVCVWREREVKLFFRSNGLCFFIGVWGGNQKNLETESEKATWNDLVFLLLVFSTSLTSGMLQIIFLKKAIQLTTELRTTV